MILKGGDFIYPDYYAVCSRVGWFLKDRDCFNPDYYALYAVGWDNFFAKASSYPVRKAI